ncbi:hypothetical protein EYF80_050092 [Liparis tanakae]|uniref:Uncharacterized protein n=1 Tax=Liparis tanakae TaxID=230148 RepID=A0A4Z2FG64_9TELE|nr:hypothetical protein EYF80_050092 [Liparis tanakae]
MADSWPWHQLGRGGLIGRGSGAPGSSQQSGYRPACTPRGNGKQKTRRRAQTNIPPFLDQAHVTPPRSVDIGANAAQLLLTCVRDALKLRAAAAATFGPGLPLLRLCRTAGRRGWEFDRLLSHHDCGVNATSKDE